MYPSHNNPSVSSSHCKDYTYESLSLENLYNDTILESLFKIQKGLK